VVAVLAPADSWLKFDAIVLIVMLPVGTVVFFAAMILANLIVGAVEIGEIHVAIVKSFGLVLAVNLISLVPYVGVYVLTPLVWISGLMLLFRLDMWETFMVMFFNWVLNFLIRLALFVMIASWLLHGGGGGGTGTDKSPSRSSTNEEGEVWDEHDVQERGGSVEFDPANREDLVVIAISFRGLPIGDAEVAHMKDFPRLRRLDLANTQVTDAGLKHLAACKQLLTLDLTGTRVTAAGTNELLKALPRLRIIQ
jgi:hypothetical protein